jgi:hypothetical protein
MHISFMSPDALDTIKPEQESAKAQEPRTKGRRTHVGPSR